MNATGSSQIRSTPRSFGLVMAGFFALLGFWPLTRGHDMRGWAVALSGTFALVATLAPPILQPLNLAWARLGLLLNRIVSPIVLALLFLTTLTPMAAILRAMGKDPLGLSFDSSANTYWKVKDRSRPPQRTMKEQF